MCISCFLCRVPGTCDLCGGLTPVRREGACHLRGTKPNQCQPAEVFPGSDTIMPTILKFIPNLASMLSPLCLLLHKGKSWKWRETERHAFEKARSTLTSTSVLVHYDPGKELVLACDASSYGIGAVLSHPSEDGMQHRPPAFASRTLAPAERNYSQLERELRSGTGVWSEAIQPVSL